VVDLKHYDGQVVFLHPFRQQGSLRDEIYEVYGTMHVSWIRRGIGVDSLHCCHIALAEHAHTE